MGKQTSRFIAILIGLIAVLAPIGGAYYVAKERSAKDQMARAELIAEDVLRRSEETSAQVRAAFAQLKDAVRLDPCSDAMIRKMATIDVASSQLQAVGYVARDHLVCSSVGRYAEGLDIGEPDFVSSDNVAIRVSRSIPEMPGVALILATHVKDGFTTVVHRDLPIDVFASDRTISVGLFSLSNRKLLLNRGDFKQEWVSEHGPKNAEFLTETHVVAIRRSTKQDYAAFAALPISEVNADFTRTAAILLPVGALAGLLLALAVMFIVRQQMALPSIIKLGLKRNEFYLEYQPIVDLQTGHWTGAEALIRWRRPEGEVIRPDHFIPVAEANGLIRKITKRVLQLARPDVIDMVKHQPQFHIAINLSSDDMHAVETVDILLELARETNISPGNIVVEATERGFLEVGRACSVFNELRRYGFKIAIDDFGTGYSSLAYLERFKVDYLKIDKTFIDTINTDAPTSQVVLHIIEMAKDMKIKMIAEGVETAEQARFLRSRGVQHAQGWLFGRPMSAAEFTRELRKQGPESGGGAQVVSIRRACAKGVCPTA